MDSLRRQHPVDATVIGKAEWIAADRCRPVDASQQPAIIIIIILLLLAAERGLNNERQAISTLGFDLVIPECVGVAAFVDDHLVEMLAPDDAEGGGFDRDERETYYVAPTLEDVFP